MDETSPSASSLMLVDNVVVSARAARMLALELAVRSIEPSTEPSTSISSDVVTDYVLARAERFRAWLEGGTDG